MAKDNAASDVTGLLDQLRHKALRITELEDKISAAEREKYELNAALQQLQTRIEAYHAVKEEWDWFFAHSLDMLVIHDERGMLKRVNPAVEKVLGYAPAEFLRLSMQDIVHPDDLSDTIAHIETIAGGVDGVNFMSRCLHKDGSWRWLAWTTPATGTMSSGVPIYAVARDVTRNKMTEQELLYRAQHDALTGLANRAMFDQQLDQAIARAGRYPGREVALLLLDLDGFKAVNDTWGHAAGDAVLKTVAERLRNTVRKCDLVARFGGDEFACLVEDPAEGALEHLGQRFLTVLRAPIDAGGREVEIGCSVGVATYPQPAIDAVTLFEHADRALYQVKADGKSAWRRYVP
ncbi:MAG TPA: sensor domain-containing diguanylate cyclase [Paraburkholderia sp.]|uniref:sensor domain-containing diguanylate cyclase n=1 Tax=Paraburkholderia sp. TaxID=1926495 RepID=UPI002B49630C|nr:sensor domain-containing diguanylate cyclase [Paraburkholderia sp.]HKR40226.1 sensor domain-containing diguanylate cyclase [Paraburkholderia sp.]